MIGLWFGDGKPWMNLFLKILADQMNQFYQEGFVVVTPEGKEMICRGLLQSDTMDLVALAAVKCLLTFHGYYGCSCCLQKDISFHDITLLICLIFCLFKHRCYG